MHLVREPAFHHANIRLKAETTVKDKGFEMGDLEFSFIVPLARDHGQALACVKSLVQEQTYDREKYEVIVVANGSNPKKTARVEELLSPQDSVVYHASANEFELYHVGAQHAAGKVLFFLECHSIASPDCLAEMAKFLRSQDVAGARCRSVGVGLARGFIQALDVRVFEEDTRPHLDADHWRKILIHGVALRREVYFAEGGFEFEYGQFAQLALAAKLHSCGRKLGYADESIVCHYYAGNLRETAQLSRDNNLGEVLYRSRNPADYCERYFGRMVEWSGRGNYRAALARSLCRVLAKNMLRNLRARRLRAQFEHLTHLCTLGPTAVLGLRWPLMKTSGMRYVALARTFFWRFDAERCYRAYRDFLRSLYLRYRLEGISRVSFPSLSETSPQACVDMACFDAASLFGFRDVEAWEGQTFRWSGPAALVRLSLPKGAYDVELILLRGAEHPAELSACFDGHWMREAPAHANLGSVFFRLDPSFFRKGASHHDLALICSPVLSERSGSPGPHNLGAAVKAVHFRPTG